MDSVCTFISVFSNYWSCFIHWNFCDYPIEHTGLSWSKLKSGVYKEIWKFGVSFIGEGTWVMVSILTLNHINWQIHKENPIYERFGMHFAAAVWVWLFITCIGFVCSTYVCIKGIIICYMKYTGWIFPLYPPVLHNMTSFYN